MDKRRSEGFIVNRGLPERLRRSPICKDYLISVREKTNKFASRLLILLSQ